MRGDGMQRFIFLLALLFSVVLSASAEEKAEHGDWTSQFLDGMGEASTHENGMSMLGMLCGTGSCRYYFAIWNIAQAKTIWVAETPYLNEAFAKTPAVGIAFPLTNGEFKTSRFSMNGFAQAVERMVDIMRDGKAQESTQEKDAPNDSRPDRT